MRRRGTGVLLLTCALLPLGGCESQEWWGGVEVGEAAPAYAAETLQGDSLALRDLRGEVVLLNVWASWCAPCRHEMPLLEELHRRYGPDGLRIVGASVDSRSARGQVERFLSQEEITYTILLDPREDVTRAFRTVGVPESFLLDREGRLVWRFRGLFDPLDDRFLERIERLLTSS